MAAAGIFHNYDYPFYYLNLRANAANRIKRYLAEVEDAIVRLRGELTTAGFDAGAQTIHFHLTEAGLESVPSVSTIWRILKRRGFVTPQPHKRPRSSWVRFEASPPNERWQSDVTHWKLACGSQVDILNFLDDHSRLIVASETAQTS